MHFFTFMAVGSELIIGTTMNHSGYDFPWDATELMPFRATTAYHDYHHSGNINGNFSGGVIIFDYLFGYNDQFYKHIDKINGEKEQ